jgi:putative NIF3 family GTP cyclohydrolase 1 type 2
MKSKSNLFLVVALYYSVYSPHTALDSVIGGINDELCEIVSGSKAHQNQVFSVSGSIVEKTSENVLNGVGFGGGRRVEFAQGNEVDLAELISRIKTGLGLPHGTSHSIMITK